jgi:hypothetical protein
MPDSAPEGSVAGPDRRPADPPDPAPVAGADPAARGDEPPTGGLTAVLGKLRDAAAAHDDELTDPGPRPPRG